MIQLRKPKNCQTRKQNFENQKKINLQTPKINLEKPKINLATPKINLPKPKIIGLGPGPVCTGSTTVLAERATREPVL